MEVVKQRTENQLMNDCKMKRDFKEKREQKEMHKLALRMVISEDPELRALVEIQNLEVLEKAEILNELGNLAHKKRGRKPRRNSSLDPNLFEGNLIFPHQRESVINSIVK